MLFFGSRVSFGVSGCPCCTHSVSRHLFRPICFSCHNCLQIFVQDSFAVLLAQHTACAVDVRTFPCAFPCAHGHLSGPSSAPSSLVYALHRLDSGRRVFCAVSPRAAACVAHLFPPAPPPWLTPAPRPQHLRFPLPTCTCACACTHLHLHLYELWCLMGCARFSFFEKKRVAHARMKAACRTSPTHKKAEGSSRAGCGEGGMAKH